MNIENLLTASLNYYSEEYTLLLQHLQKCSNQLTPSNTENHLPLLIFKTQDIYLWIKDKDVSEYPFLFTDPEEILFILYQFLSTGDPVYICKEVSFHLIKEDVEKNIEGCLLNNDKEGFNYWVKILKNQT